MRDWNSDINRALIGELGFAMRITLIIIPECAFIKGNCHRGSDVVINMLKKVYENKLKI